MMAEFGIMVAEGPAHVAELVAVLADPNGHRIPAPLLDGLAVNRQIEPDLSPLRAHDQIVDPRFPSGPAAWCRANRPDT
jgi:hypothetical protein